MTESIPAIRLAPFGEGCELASITMTELSDSAIREVLSVEASASLRALSSANFILISSVNTDVPAFNINTIDGYIVLRGTALLLCSNTMYATDFSDLLKSGAPTKASLAHLESGLSRGDAEGNGIELKKWKWGQELPTIPAGARGANQQAGNYDGPQVQVIEGNLQDLMSILFGGRVEHGPNQTIIGDRSFDIYSLARLPRDNDVPPDYRQLLEVPAYAASKDEYPEPATVVLSCLSFYIELMNKTRKLGHIPEPVAIERMKSAQRLVELVSPERSSDVLDWPITADQWKVD